MAHYIDAHIHLDKYKEQERSRILNDLKTCGVEGLIAVSMDLESCKENHRLHMNGPDRVLPAYGYHPEQPPLAAEAMEELVDWIRHHREEMVAVGEVGLPYYMRKEAEEKGNPFSSAPYVAMLEKFIQLAGELNKPIVLHAVYEDAQTACDLLEKHGLQRAHFHWFKGDLETTERMIRNRYLISVTPDVVYEEEIQQLVRYYPLELMMAETDGPWPFEGPFTGRMTHPRMMASAAAKIAELKGLSPEETAGTLLRNTRDFYGVKYEL